MSSRRFAVLMFAGGYGLGMLTAALHARHARAQDCAVVIAEINERLEVALANARAVANATGPWFEHYPSDPVIREMVLEVEP